MKLIQEILCVIGGFFFIYLGTVFIRAQDDVRALKKELQTSRMQSIKKVQQQLADPNLTLIRGDVFKFISTCRHSFDIIFADPPYDLPRFGEIPQMVLDSPLVHDGTLFIMEHPREHDFSALSHFSQQRVYGKVNFSIFEVNSRPQGDQ